MISSDNNEYPRNYIYLGMVIVADMGSDFPNKVVGVLSFFSLTGNWNESLR